MFVSHALRLLQEKGIKHNGNLSMDEIIEIAKVMRSRSCAKQLKGTVKEILGTCVSVGCTVDHQEAREVQEKVCRAGGPRGAYQLSDPEPSMHRLASHSSSAGLPGL